MGCYRLHNTVMALKVASDCPAQLLKRRRYGVATLCPAALRIAKGDVIVSTSQSTGLAMVIVAAGDNAAMDFENQIRRHRAVGRLFPNPRIGVTSCAELPLRMSQYGPGIVTHGESLLLFLRRELRALYAGRSYSLKAQLFFVSLINPLGQIRKPT